MSAWITQFFLNPALFWPGVAAVSVPIVIHLINRLNHRRVRFAAMEFLLASEQKNRRRILLEQLLLLLLRIALVLMLMALIARLVLDSSQLSLFQGAKSHHLIVLDDSGSMQDRLGEDSAFDAAKEVIRKLVAEGARRPGTQKLTLLLASQPTQTFSGFNERIIDDTLLDEVTTRLEDLECSYGTVDFVAALQAAQDRLADDATDLKQLHVISDFRHADWFDNEAIAETLRALDNSGVAVNLVRTVESPHDNIAITRFDGEVESAAAGIPVEFHVSVTNFGTREADDVRVAVNVDGRRLPVTRVFSPIAPGKEATEPLSLRFERAGLHRVEVQLENDALRQDNTRYLAVAIPEENPILIIDGVPGGEEAQYIADALAADPSVTGLAPLIDGPDYLRKSSLDRFHAIYMVNVPDLPADALTALQRYVAGGGGLVWFLGDIVKPAFYNDLVEKDGNGLFPAPLASAPERLPRDTSNTPQADIVISDHPLLRILSGDQNPFIDAVFVNYYYPLDAEWTESTEPGAARIIAKLRNGRPLLLENEYGKGRVVSCLTSAGPRMTPEGVLWNNWAGGPGAPSYAVFQLDLAKYVARRDRSLPQRIVGEPISDEFSRVVYEDRVEIVTPDQQVTEIKAAAAEDEADENGIDRTNLTTLKPLRAVFRDTGHSGIYTVRKTAREQLSARELQVDEQLIAYNVPSSESDLAVMSNEQLRTQIGNLHQLTVQSAGVFDWIRSEAPGQEVRWWLLALLLVVGVCEQFMACRLSYHPT